MTANHVSPFNNNNTSEMYLLEQFVQKLPHKVLNIKVDNHQVYDKTIKARKNELN